MKLYLLHRLFCSLTTELNKTITLSIVYFLLHNAVLIQYNYMSWLIVLKNGVYLKAGEHKILLVNMNQVFKVSRSPHTFASFLNGHTI